MTDYTSPKWDSAALVVIDVQRDFLDEGSWTIPGTSDVLPQLTSLVEAFRKARRPIVHVVRFYEPGGSDVDLLRRDTIEGGTKMAAPGTDGAEIAAGLLPDDSQLDAEHLLSGKPQIVTDDEVVLFKPRWSAFFRTDLESWLRVRNVDTVVVAGCNLPNCPRATLFDASERDFRTVLVTDAVSQITEERVADVQRIGVELRTTAEAVDSLTA
jgi:nicotinamidase-related amidase